MPRDLVRITPRKVKIYLVSTQSEIVRINSLLKQLPLAFDASHRKEFLDLVAGTDSDRDYDLVLHLDRHADYRHRIKRNKRDILEGLILTTTDDIETSWEGPRRNYFVASYSTRGWERKTCIKLFDRYSENSNISGLWNF